MSQEEPTSKNQTVRMAKREFGVNRRRGETNQEKGSLASSARRRGIQKTTRPVDEREKEERPREDICHAVTRRAKPRGQEKKAVPGWSESRKGCSHEEK